MIDQYGRMIDYLRISLTSRCNLRCIYCMPEEDTEIQEEYLSFDEIERIVSLMSQMGIRHVRLTGGEPLLRKNIQDLVKRIKKISGIETVHLTTNAILLNQMIDRLADAGLDGVNISLDTRDRENFARITRRDHLFLVENSLESLKKYPNMTVKINCVMMDQKDREFLEIAELARDNPFFVRYIEMMPIGLGRQNKGRSEEEIKELLKKTYGSYQTVKEKIGNGPSHYYEFQGFQGKIGFISAVTHKFCSSCNRVRLTSGGFLKTCLQYETGGDLRQILRNGAEDQEILEYIKNIIFHKPKEHQFFNSQEMKEEESHLMSQIGG
ncbi:MAG: GTP 3',8-cyclase MoaA [Clostridiales bacterium]|nr:GTP 3',8-cyclase MoaA [Clostridiales bacterium]